MELVEFAERLAKKKPALSIAQIALALLWLRQKGDPSASATPGELARELSTLGFGTAHSTRLAAQLSRTRLTLKARGKVRLKADALAKVQALLADVLDPVAPVVSAADEFVPQSVWKGTRAYIERVGQQMNGCFAATYYDAASVMLRRLVETLLVEAYEHLGRQADIQDGAGNYLMLGDIIEKATKPTGIPLGRDPKKALAAVKELGDRAAHNRRYYARREDLDQVRSGVRVLLDDLVGIASLRREKAP